LVLPVMLLRCADILADRPALVSRYDCHGRYDGRTAARETARGAELAAGRLIAIERAAGGQANSAPSSATRSSRSRCRDGDQESGIQFVARTERSEIRGGGPALRFAPCGLLSSSRSRCRNQESGKAYA